MEIARNIIPLEYANAVRDYARGNLDEAELWAELTALGYDALEVEWHIANPGQRIEWGAQMDDELRFFDAIDHFPLEQRDAAQRWLKKRVVLAKVAEQRA